MKHYLLLLLCLFCCSFSQSFVSNDVIERAVTGFREIYIECLQEKGRIQGNVVVLDSWVYSSKNLSYSIPSKYKLSQVINNNAIFRFSNSSDFISLPLRHVKGKVFKGKSLLKSSEVIREVRRAKVNLTDGFLADVIFYESLDTLLSKDSVFSKIILLPKEDRAVLFDLFKNK